MCRERHTGCCWPVNAVTTEAEARNGAAALRLAPLASRLVALLTLITLAPLMLLIGVAVLADSGLPVLFRQERIGLHGRRFWMLKFRKFHASIGEDTAPLTLPGDSRCTRVGRLLAKTKLDELPQLWNVTRGDMAIVGPRPEVPEFEDCFIGSWRELLTYRPGIFGPSQAMFHSEASLYPPGEPPQRFYREVLFPTKAALDLAYYPSRSILGDLRWVVVGILAVCGAGPERLQRSRRACRHAVSMPTPGEAKLRDRASGYAGLAGHAHGETSRQHIAE